MGFFKAHLSCLCLSWWRSTRNTVKAVRSRRGSALVEPYSKIDAANPISEQLEACLTVVWGVFCCAIGPLSSL